MSIVERLQMKCDGPECDNARPAQLTHSHAIRDAERAGWVLGVVPVPCVTSYGSTIMRPGDLCPGCYRKHAGAQRG